MSVSAGKDGVTFWRYELAPSGAESGIANAPGVRSREKLAAVLETIPQGELLLRGDSVAFPPGGVAHLHRHQGPGIRCVIGHGFGLTPNTLAEMHVAAVSANVMDGCECVGPTKLTGDVVTAPLVMESGSLPVPTGPGLGASLDESALARWTPAPSR